MLLPRFVGACRSSLLVAATVLTTSLPALPAVAAPLSHEGAGRTGTVPADACGPLIPKASGGFWSCTFLETFDGTELNQRRWGVTKTSESGFTSSGECFVDSPANVRVGGGVLSLTARRLARPMTCTSPRGTFTTSYTGGMVSTWARFGQTYGRFEVRARFPAAKTAGLHSAFWLYPANPRKYGPWPASGEIDIAEFYTHYPDRVVPYVHYNGDKYDPYATNTKCFVSYPEAFHTYVVEWTPYAITVKYDGKICIRDVWKPIGGQVKPQPFDHPFVINLTQALGFGTNRATSLTPLPGTMQVDRVRVWR